MPFNDRRRIVERGTPITNERLIKNKWKWDWLESAGSDGIPFYKFIRKIDEAGKAMCEYCNHVLNYASLGKSAIKVHTEKEVHKRKAQEANDRTQQSLPSSYQPSTSNTDDYGLAGPSNETRKVPLSDRTTNMEAMILAYVAEHNLPLSQTGDLVKLMLAGAHDVKALQGAKLQRTSGSYKLECGLAPSLQEDLVKELRQRFFSLTVDEATMKEQKTKVVSIMVSYFDDKLGRTIINHLKSVKIIRTTAEAIFTIIDDVFKESEIPFKNLVSVMMDSCPSMRGIRGGVETLIRQRRQPNLLDIGGETCHTIHNATKRFCKPFGGWIENLLHYLHNDFKDSPLSITHFQEVCFLLNLPVSYPQRFVSHRWLNVLLRVEETLSLMSGLLVYYYAFIPEKDEKKFEKIIEDIMEEREVSDTARERLSSIRKDLKKVRGTAIGRGRKEVIVDKLFYHGDRTKLQMDFYATVLPILNRYVVEFQTKQQTIHRYWDRQLETVREFLSLFVKPEIMRPLQKLSALLSYKAKKEDMLGVSSRILGKPKLIREMKGTDEFSTFMEHTTCAYIDCSNYLLNKLPLNSPVLRCLSAIDPVAQQTSEGLRLMEELPKYLKVLSEDEETSYTIELKKISLLDLSSCDNLKPDEWWGAVLKRSNLPLVKRVLSASLSLFTGPVIEGSFSETSNIISNKRNSMKTETLNALQMVRYHLHATGKSAVDMFHREDIDHSPVNVNMVRNMQKSRASKRKLESETLDSRQSEEFFYELPKQKQKKQSLDETRQIYTNILGQKDL